MLNELITKLESNIKEAQKNNILLERPTQIHRDFQKNRISNLGSAILADIKLLQKKITETQDQELSILSKKLMTNFTTENTAELLSTLSEIKASRTEQEKDSLEITLPKLPKEIQEEVESDIKEIKKCYSAGCYRSAVVLCGRILETALHRKYYDTTGQDILEKNPGIGLGNLIAKLNDKGVELDPGLSQQIHLVNQVRIFTVHKKQRTFYPTKAQANAIVLFTIDTLEKLF